ncbi:MULTISPECIES: DUF305 domain-containing protein [Mycobacterium]|uniref:DUF305 domain-containing protein n=5 Tax=Mycobacterium avium complex (MAC) TaxID=120793 RepID=A0AAI8SNP2_MYCAV|nr:MULTISPECIES: DUF305 domain-containing protein [Mycobacterium]APA76259.1 DUF305 domain-containing protein [Mycobacterium avium subsp. hominissuis]APT10403.1 DUF305 domain-containing protein [Mycobacterium avium subsp. hominissuis]ARV82715.1 DUF305 domain-containing protein [Mycobacterium intracellulare subsp. chimaera]ASQ89257.1 DUF305 domain-containing protein [Mycobacterium intracellulare subsp. chimaera]ASW95888.1 DUF305 domain-containing protein [Mycobacterium intracellulare]
MRIRTLTAAVAALAALVGAGACSNSHTDQAGATKGAPTSASAPDGHKQADVVFAQHMIPHHQQAIEMSDIVLGKQGIDARVVDLANQIKAAQGPEIEQMQTWLGQWGTPSQTMMPTRSAMPGMSGMSDEDMAALKNAQGVEASRLFLTQMIQHHRGAIAMAQDEVNSGGYPAATAMARSIIASQQQEIDTMQKLLASL